MQSNYAVPKIDAGNTREGITAEFDFTCIRVTSTLPYDYRQPNTAAAVELLAPKGQEPREFAAGAFAHAGRRLSPDPLEADWPIVIAGLEQYRRPPIAEEKLLEQIAAHYPRSHTNSDYLAPFDETHLLRIQRYSMYFGQFAVGGGVTIELAAALPRGWQATNAVLPIAWLQCALEMVQIRGDYGSPHIQWKVDTPGVSNRYARKISLHPAIPPEPLFFPYSHVNTASTGGDRASVGDVHIGLRAFKAYMLQSSA